MSCFVVKKSGARAVGLAIMACGFSLLLTPLVVAQSASIMGASMVSARPALVENRGQWPTDALFVSQHSTGLVRVHAEGLGLQLVDRRDPDGAGVFLMQRFVGATGKATARGTETLPGVEHFLLGNDRFRWQRDLSRFQSIELNDVLPGLELAVTVGERSVVQELHVAPGTALGDVNWSWDGATDVRVVPDGSLEIDTLAGTLRLSRPVGRQRLVDGSEEAADLHFRPVDDRTWGLTASDVVPGSGVIASSTLIWGSFIGGSSGESPKTVVLHPSGDYIITGNTGSTDYPVTPGALSTGFGGGVLDGFVMRFNGMTNDLMFSTYLGGSGTDGISEAVLSSTNEIVLGGGTDSPDFPVTPGAFMETLQGNTSDSFVMRLDDMGSTVIASTLIGGSQIGSDAILSIDVGPDGSVYATGRTCSNDFPITPGAVIPTYQGGCDGFVFRLDASLSALLYSTYLGGTTDETPFTIKRDADGTVLIAGFPGSDYPTTPGAYLEFWDPGCTTGFLTRLNADGSALVWSTFQEGNGRLGGITSDGGIIVAGRKAFCFGTTPGAFSNWGEPFLCKFDGSGAFKHWATLGSGGVSTGVAGIGLDAADRITLACAAGTGGFPSTPDAFQPEATGGLSDAGIMQFNADGSQLLYASFLGGFANGAGNAWDVVRLPCGEAIMVGSTFSPAHPIGGENVFDPTFNGGSDGWIARMQVISPWTNLGNSLPGSNGRPDLKGGGGLCEHSKTQLLLTDALPNASAGLVIGFSDISLPFKGGTLVPSPDIVLLGLPVDGDGQISLASDWPPGVPSGVDTVFQFWVSDPAGPAGWAASNGIMGTTP